MMAQVTAAALVAENRPSRRGAIHSRHVHVQENKFGMDALAQPDALLATSGFAHQLERARAVEHGAYSDARHRSVVDDHYPRTVIRARFGCRGFRHRIDNLPRSLRPWETGVPIGYPSPPSATSRTGD